MKKIYKYSSLFRKLIERLSSESLDVMDINLNWFPFRELIQLTSMAHLTSLSESSWHGSWLLAVMLRLTAMCLTTEVATVVPTGVGNLCRTLWFALSHWISSWSDAHSEYMVKLPTLHLNYRYCWWAIHKRVTFICQHAGSTRILKLPVRLSKNYSYTNIAKLDLLLS